MATVSILLGFRGNNGVPVMRTDVRVSETKTSSGASQQSTGSAEAGEYWEIGSTGNIWVRFAANPTAAAGDDFLIPANSVRHFQSVLGDKVAVIDA